MGGNFKACIAFGFLLAYESPAQTRITVFVLNLAEMPGGELERARQEGDRILSRSGITIEWVVCSLSGAEADRHPRCQGRAVPTDLFLRIFPGLPDRSVVGPSNGYAYALVPTDGGHGFLADVYVRGAEAFARSERRLRAVFLGHMMAHEVGHLLLGAGHSVAGIMQCPWDRQSRALAAQGSLLFPGKEAERMRAAVRNRMRGTAEAGAVK